MTNAYTKTIILDDGKNVVQLGGTEIKYDSKNKLNESNLAQEQSGQTRTLALNLNQITEQHEITAVIDDTVADKLNGSYDNKEEVKNQLKTIYKSQREVDFVYGNETHTGFIQQLSITEKSDSDASFYRIKARHLTSDSMEQ